MAATDRCEDCGDRDVPLRAIKMREGGRSMLCEGCFRAALDDGRVHPEDPRVEDARHV